MERYSKYSPENVDKIREIIESAIEQGVPRDFEIEINDRPVIHRCCDLDRFDRHESYLRSDTHTVTFKIFYGSSPNCKKYFLTVPGREANSQVLQGAPDSPIAKMIAAERNKWEHDLLQKEHSRLKADYEEIKTENSELKEQVKAYEKKVLHLGNIDLLEVGGKLLGNALTRNPGLLGGVLPQGPPPEAQGEASYEVVEEEGSSYFCQQVEELFSQFTPEEQPFLLGFIEALAMDRSLFGVIEKTLNNPNKDENI